MKSPARIDRHFSEGKLIRDVRFVAWSDIASVEQCLSWIESDFLGVNGARWARTLVARNGYKETTELLAHIERVFPTYLIIDSLPKFSDVGMIVSEDFLLSREDSKFLDYAYKIFVRRPPDESGYNFYKSKILSGMSKSSIVKDFSLSFEASQHSDRVFLSKRGFDELKRKVKQRSENLMFRRPKFIPADFFFRKPMAISPSETASEWHLVYRPDLKAKMILSPGMNLAGSYTSNGRFRCSLDWILFGPKIFLRAGDYELLLEITCDDDFAYLFDVSADGGMFRAFELELVGSSKLRLRFKLDRDVADFETRVLNLMSVNRDMMINQLSLKKVR